MVGIDVSNSHDNGEQMPTNLERTRSLDDHMSPFSYPLRQQMFTEEAPLTAIDSMILEQLESCHSLCMYLFRKSGRVLSDETMLNIAKTAEALMRRFVCTLETYEKIKKERSNDV